MNVEVIAIIAVSFFGICSVIISLGAVVWMIRRSGSGSKKMRAESTEETRMIQEIHHGLNRMEDRVEALETLIMDSDRRKRSDFDQELRRG